MTRAGAHRAGAGRVVAGRQSRPSRTFLAGERRRDRLALDVGAARSGPRDRRGRRRDDGERGARDELDPPVTRGHGAGVLAGGTRDDRARRKRRRSPRRSASSCTRSFAAPDTEALRSRSCAQLPVEHVSVAPGACPPCDRGRADAARCPLGITGKPEQWGASCHWCQAGPRHRFHQVRERRSCTQKEVAPVELPCCGIERDTGRPAARRSGRCRDWRPWHRVEIASAHAIGCVSSVPLAHCRASPVPTSMAIPFGNETDAVPVLSCWPPPVPYFAE